MSRLALVALVVASLAFGAVTASAAGLALEVPLAPYATSAACPLPDPSAAAEAIRCE